METLSKIRCPRCPKGVLFAIDKSVKKGIIEGKCQWCGALCRYDTETEQYEVISTKTKVN